jgi:dTDP-4-dehydrorhamnose reductase
MRVLILGSTGILGHTLFLYLKNNSSFEVFGLCSERAVDTKFYLRYSEFLKIVDLSNLDKVSHVIAELRPTVVVNCAVKKDFKSGNVLSNIIVNSILPHKLDELSKHYHFQFVHISTDSVFGDYYSNKSESDTFEIKDMYSASKLLGEPSGRNTIIIRTSIVGHSLKGENGFLDSVLSSKSYCGFTDVFFSGTTTLELSKIIHMIINNQQVRPDIFHVTGIEISKYDLARVISEVYSLDTSLTKSAGIKIKRDLSSLKFRIAFNYEIPDWYILLSNLNNFYKNNNDIYEK